VLFFVLVALLAPIIAPGDPQEFVDAPNLPPSARYLFGTEGSGKDVFRQTVWGARLSLAVGFGAAIALTAISTVAGVTAGYFRGRVDDILTFLMNLFLVMPALPLLIILSGYLKPGLVTLVLVIAITGWAFGARIMRAQALSLREKDFVAAAIVSGQSDFGIIFRQIMPNMANLIVGLLIGGVVGGIGAITALSFLGLTDLSEVSWGSNLFWAQANGALLLGAWWTFLPSGLSVALTAFGLSLINYGMDEVTNPRLRAEKELKNVIKDIGAQRVRATPVVPRPH
jgi:peptide/nickel transport system permease protein